MSEEIIGQNYHVFMRSWHKIKRERRCNHTTPLAYATYNNMKYLQLCACVPSLTLGAHAQRGLR